MPKATQVVETISENTSLIDIAKSLAGLIESEAETAEKQRHLTDAAVQAIRDGDKRFKHAALTRPRRRKGRAAK